MSHESWWWQKLVADLDKAGYMIVQKPTLTEKGKPSKPGPPKPREEKKL